MDGGFIVQGIACRWGRWGRPGANGEPALRFRAGSIAIDRPINLHLWHDTSKTFATTRNGTFQVWSDANGLYFEAKLEATRRSLWITNKIRDGYLRGVSVGMANDCRFIDHAEGEEIASGALREISFADNPAQPGTAVWLDSEQDHELPIDVLAARQLWQASRHQPAPLAASRSRRPSAALLASVDRLLNMPRPVACRHGSR